MFALAQGDTAGPTFVLLGPDGFSADFQKPLILFILCNAAKIYRQNLHSYCEIIYKKIHIIKKVTQTLTIMLQVPRGSVTLRNGRRDFGGLWLCHRAGAPSPEECS